MTLIEQFQRWVTKAGLDHKEHQEDGVLWCLARETCKIPLSSVRGGIVADEMGLGKTILMLGCIVSNFKGLGGVYRTLVILPRSLLQQWAELMERFLGHRPLLYHGSRIKSITPATLEEAPIVLTTYGMISKRKKESPLAALFWNRIIFDEAHHMRNAKTAIFRGAVKLRGNIKWLVTGTPVQNRHTDFYSLCAVLGLEAAFYANPANIPHIINYHCLRRTKADIGIKLPPLDQQNIIVRWRSDAERNLAYQIHSLVNFCPVGLDNVDALIRNLCGNSTLPALTRARQICVSPHLLQGAVRRLKIQGRIAPDVHLRRITTCSKVTAIVEHIRAHLDVERRKLIFCHYRGEIDLFRALFEKVGISVGVVDGRTRASEKKCALRSVLSRGDWRSICKTWWKQEVIYNLVSPFLAPQVLLVQIQTASEGLNMQHFHDIYFSSPHWNPAVEDQAIARCHRIGQQAPVKVYRFLMEAFDDENITLDYYCQQIQETKRKLMTMFHV